MIVDSQSYNTKSSKQWWWRWC